jgi:hypothetical protein
MQDEHPTSSFATTWPEYELDPRTRELLRLDASEIAPYTAMIIVWTSICALLGWIRRRSWHWTGLILLNLIVAVGQVYFGMNVLAADH